MTEIKKERQIIKFATELSPNIRLATVLGCLVHN